MFIGTVWTGVGQWFATSVAMSWVYRHNAMQWRPNRRGGGGAAGCRQTRLIGPAKLMPR